MQKDENIYCRHAEDDARESFILNAQRNAAAAAREKLISFTKKLVKLE
jgi:hypothetical protein